MLDFQHKMPKNGLHRNVFENVPLNMVDFGFVTKFVRVVDGDSGSKQVKHLPKSEVDVFRGNMIFSSINQL